MIHYWYGLNNTLEDYLKAAAELAKRLDILMMREGMKTPRLALLLAA